MSKMKEEMMERDNNRFDDSAYETLSEENKFKKVAEFHVNQMKEMNKLMNIPSGFWPDVSGGISAEEERLLTEEKRREEAESRDRDIANGWYPEE